MTSTIKPPGTGKTTINERVAQLIESLGKTPNSFAKSIGKTFGSIASICKGDTKPSYDMLEGIFTTYPNISRDWLLMGEGAMFRGEEKTSRGDEYLMKHLAQLEARVSEQSKTIAVLLEQRGGLPGKGEGVPFSQNLPSDIWVESPFFSTLGVQIGVHSES